MRTLANVLIAIVLLSSCGSTRRQVRSQPEVKTMLSVENRNFNDMRVYVQHESTQRVNIVFDINELMESYWNLDPLLQ